MGEESVLAWVESPLQLIGAAEWAAAERRAVPLAGRLTAQMSETADALVARRAWFSELEPYLGIPWALLSRHRHWLVGDGFSGQFRLAASVLRPRRITFLDDGANTVPFADALLGTRPYTRPGVTERGLTTRVAPIARATVLDRAVSRRVDFFTAFDLGDARRTALRDSGIGVRGHRFEWTRTSAPTSSDLGPRVILGSARPVDGRMPISEYLDWVRDAASLGPATYLPHRRETPAQLDAVGAIPGVEVRITRLPVELVLAGTPHPLELHTMPSSTTTTLRHVLRGTGSVIRTGTAAAAIDAGIETAP